MKVKETEMVKCVQCNWTGPASQLKPLKPKGNSTCVCPRCGFPGFEKLTEESTEP